MPITIAGDQEFENIPSTQNKALRINMNENVYGTFAEIGAGQETVRHFFGLVVPAGLLQRPCLHMIWISVMLFMGLSRIGAT